MELHAPTYSAPGIMQALPQYVASFQPVTILITEKTGAKIRCCKLHNYVCFVFCRDQPNTVCDKPSSSDLYFGVFRCDVMNSCTSDVEEISIRQP